MERVPPGIREEVEHFLGKKKLSEGKKEKVLVIVEEGEEKEIRPEDSYQEALQWYRDQVDELSVEERITVLRRIIEKYEVLGVDVTEVRDELEGLE